MTKSEYDDLSDGEILDMVFVELDINSDGDGVKDLFDKIKRLQLMDANQSLDKE